MEKVHRSQMALLHAKLDKEREKNKALTRDQNELNSARFFTYHLLRIH